MPCVAIAQEHNWQPCKARQPIISIHFITRARHVADRRTAFQLDGERGAQCHITAQLRQILSFSAVYFKNMGFNNTWYVSDASVQRRSVIGWLDF